ncbi:MAG: DUF4157 domain-containing protein [Kofleriaceae bacterium]
MTHERDYAREHVADFDAKSTQPIPGRTSASAELTSPTRPVPSGLVMRKRDHNGVAADAETAVGAASGSSGSSLPVPLQRKFESSLGADLSSVRVHTDAPSQDAASAVGAKAYTVGQDIHFGQGHYDPASTSGQQLLAHEVAHTVQQRGGSTARQHKLEVSGPQDAAEHEADRAAEAMVAGAPFEVGGAGEGVARKPDPDALETKEMAAKGQDETVAEARKSDVVMQASNSADTTDAKAALGLLQKNQTMLENGAAMISPHQSGPGEAIHDMMHGKESKLATQIPLNAISDNAALITDIQAYLAEGFAQGTATNEFKSHYEILMADFGRVDAVASKYAGTSLKTMKPGDANAVVQDAAEAGGHSTAELKGTYDQLLKDPAVAAAKTTVEEATKNLEAMPARVTADTTTMISANKTMTQAINTATTAKHGVHSLQMREAFAAAKPQADAATTAADSAKELVISGGKAAVDAVKKEIVDHAGPVALSKWGGIAAKGAASGGETIMMEALDTLVTKPAKKLLDKALTDANAAVGIIDAKAQLDANLEKEQKDQDTSTIETFKAAKLGMTSAIDTAMSTMSTYAKTSVEFDRKKLLSAAAFKAFTTAIQTAAKAKGKGADGKALAEMASFLEEAENFLVQANLVIDLGKRTMNGGEANSLDLKAKARAALRKISGRQAWMAHSYKFKKAGGEVVDYYGAQQVTLKITEPGLDSTEAERKGQNRADGVTADNPLAANEAIPSVLPKVEAMRDKVNAIRNQLMAEVFGGHAK